MIARYVVLFAMVFFSATLVNAKPKNPTAQDLEKMNSVFGGFCKKKNNDGSVSRIGAAAIDCGFAIKLALQRCQGGATEEISELSGKGNSCVCENLDSCGKVISCDQIKARCGGKRKDSFDSSFCEDAGDFCSGYEIKAAKKAANTPLKTVKTPAPTPEYIEGSNGYPEPGGRMTPAVEEDQKIGGAE